MGFLFSIVPEYQRLVRFTLGRYDGAPRGPGWVWLIPFLHASRMVDLREDVIELQPQTCITRDNAPVTIDMIVFMRVVSPEESVLRVANYRYAAESIAVTTLRSVIGDIVLDNVLAQREQINGVMQVKLDEVTERWGVKINAVEIREITPPKDIQEAMSRQMSAERHRRAVVLEAEGTREAAVTIANGNRDAAILNAEGEKQSVILNAEGSRQAAILAAEGYANALQAIYTAANGLDQNTMALQYLEMMKSLATSDSTKWVIPMEITSFVSTFARNMAGAASGNGNSGNGGSTPPPAPPTTLPPPAP
jgi:regulator of protease activity HflC (stomatin/prohibitin superfamily)